MVLLLALSLSARAEDKTFSPAKPQWLPTLTPQEEAKTFVLPKGYYVELVLSDPIIKEPVVSVFDGNGRMYVAEMRSYMQDIDGTDEHAKVGRVSLHWSSRHNGVFDKHTVFIDHLLLPRMILPVADGLLVNETDSDDIWLYRDTNGDGVADKKELVYAGGPRGGNLEHQPSGLIWDRDNWLYQAVSSYRLRLKGTNVVKEPTPSNSGQWGLTQDDYGKLFFVNAGGELGPVNFQEPIVYGAFKAKDEPSLDFMAVWPLVGLADVEGGRNRFRPENNTLNHFTACCGPDIFRGDRLPLDVRGDLFFGEPVGRLIRRAKIEVQDGVTHLVNPYDHSEFMRSTDPNFRPINMVTAPDGTMYIVDMYRGIIQEGNWVKQGSYLRTIVQKFQLDKNIDHGRIWRLRHKDFKLGPQPHMLDETPAQLVKHLTAANGWWRDTAQKLIVLRNDKSVVPALTKMAISDPNPLARLDALWTLEGLDSVSPDFLRVMLADQNPQVRAAAVRVSESVYENGDRSIVPDVRAMAKDSDPNVAVQVMLTANLLKWTDSKQFAETIVSNNQSAGVQTFGQALLLPPAAAHREFSESERRILARGSVIYNQLCFACHGNNGKGMPLQGGAPGTTMAPPLAGSSTVNGVSEGIINVLLKGLSGPVGGKNYGSQMVSMQNNDNEWVADITSFVRNNFGNSSPFINASEVARVRDATKDHNAPWTLDELHAILPQSLANRSQWKVSASHHSDAARLAIDGRIQTRYDTDASQTPGMWYQIELPQATSVCGLRLDAGDSFNDYPRGYKVQLSDDGKTWGEPVASGHGSGVVTEIFFPATKGKFIRITQTGSVSGLFWSIHELRVFEPGAPVMTKAAPVSTFE